MRGQRDLAGFMVQGLGTQGPLEGVTTSLPGTPPILRALKGILEGIQCGLFGVLRMLLQ